MIGFASSTRVYGAWLESLLSGEEAGYPPVGGKERARTRISGERLLSVPVVGGSAALKRRDCRDVLISDHGRWREVHLGTLQAVYGKTPFFPYIYPRIERIYEERGEGRLEELNKALHELVIECLGLTDGVIEMLREAREEDKKLFVRLAEERRERIDENNSILEVLFRLGKEGLFVLLGK